MANILCLGNWKLLSFMTSVYLSPPVGAVPGPIRLAYCNPLQRPGKPLCYDDRNYHPGISTGMQYPGGVSCQYLHSVDSHTGAHLSLRPGCGEIEGPDAVAVEWYTPCVVSQPGVLGPAVLAHPAPLREAFEPSVKRVKHI